ncbi:hypothetical protein SADUNF_Sadunf17G0122400 [Salix dunnii]|uniref:Uncharacterized protein n=1 Tax=Salix dunnii TaxID=1413687 RepID=A0A835J802_9ROSI|nr:hypothetical protein SADUNF_Sadunf17G0122400 [Salix dunnii]
MTEDESLQKLTLLAGLTRKGRYTYRAIASEISSHFPRSLEILVEQNSSADEARYQFAKLMWNRNPDVAASYNLKTLINCLIFLTLVKEEKMIQRLHTIWRIPFLQGSNSSVLSLFFLCNLHSLKLISQRQMVKDLPAIGERGGVCEGCQLFKMARKSTDYLHFDPWFKRVMHLSTKQCYHKMVNHYLSTKKHPKPDPLFQLSPMTRPSL